jgi:DegV family protein with EDD domain
VNLDVSEFYDGVNITNKDIFEFVDKTDILPKTAARSAYDYQEFFENFMNNNQADALIHLSLSKELSCSYENAKSASEQLKNVYVIDTRSLSSGCGLLVLSCVDKIKQGKNLETILNEIRNEILKVQASFIISNLKYLYKGGRCSAIAVLGANILRIRPKIKLSDGKMCVDKKYMGKYDNLVLKYVEDLLQTHQDIDKNRVFITYTTHDEVLNSKIAELLKKAEFNEIIFNFAGSTIASHCGENCLGVLFLSNVNIK